jgi:Asp-tRNA(Asn)/Glu-tRNA(Gln) amidotransferase A subunit family amidase
MSLLKRIDALEARFSEREPSLLAFLPEESRFRRLRREAEDLLARHPDPDARPRLFGRFLGVKDIFHADGFPTRAGTDFLELRDHPEAESVTALKHAGALVVGKTVTTEFAYFAPGPTCNPHDSAHTPGGSSSGSAAAVAAELCDLSLGTQTGGSITRPAAFCGVVGYKPSFGRISTAGVIPFSRSADHIGLFARTVGLAREAAQVLCGRWEPSSAEGRKPVLGIPTGPYLARASDEGLAHLRSTSTLLAASGFAVETIEAMPDFEEIQTRHLHLIAAEAARVHSVWFAEYGDRYHPVTADLIRGGQQVTPDALAHAIQGCTRLRQELTALMDARGVDLWISPAAPGPAPRGLDATGDPVMNLPWTHSGLPTLSLPAGRTADGLPLGLQIAARWYQDEVLFEWGGMLEECLICKET